MIRRFLLLVVLVVSLPSAHGFSLLGNFATWQTPGIGYNPEGTEIGGPMQLGEEYRWETPTIYYAFDQSFLNYFGNEGIKAVNAAMKILNDIQPASTMSSNLTEFPLDTIRVNATAQTLGLLDMKSVALAIMMEELGLARPEQYTWTLRSRTVTGTPPITNYVVISRNFDPVSLQPTPYVNSSLLTYSVQEFRNPDYADAVESISPANGSIFLRRSVAGQLISTGEFYIGLTRDDIGGLRYLLRPNNYNVENLPPNTTVTAGGVVTAGSVNVSQVFLPVGFTNAAGGGGGGGVANAVNTALRGGKNKLQFVRANYDSLLGQTFQSQASVYQDSYVQNSRLLSQTVRRVANQPDFLFLAADLGVFTDGTPVYTRRTGNLISNDGINGNAAQPGPGVIRGRIDISFTTTLPYNYHQRGPGDPPPTENDFLTLSSSGLWGSFDGTDSPPVVFPSSISIQELEDLVVQ